jgi:arylsulfatase A-like enzyme
MFFSDNGGSPLTGANNQPLRGSKYNLFEGGIRVPFILHWQDHIESNSIYPYRFSTLDILPTCLQAAGIVIPNQLDGNGILENLMAQEPAISAAKPFFWQFRDQIAVRDGDWKLVKSSDYRKRRATTQIKSGPQSEDHWQLYDLAADKSEQNNVYSQYPEVAERLKLLVSDWQDELRNSRKAD